MNEKKNEKEYGAKSEHCEPSRYVTLPPFLFLAVSQLQAPRPNTFISKHPEFKLFVYGGKKVSNAYRAKKRKVELVL
jgi:hypothetical protein